MMLLATLAAPFAAAIWMMLGSGRDATAALRTATVSAIAIAAYGAWALTGGGEAVSWSWFTVPGTAAEVTFALDAGGAGGWLALLTLVLGPVAMLGGAYAAGERMREYAAALFAAQGCLVGAFLAGDLVLFYICFEAGLLPFAMLVALLGDGELRRRATVRFVVYTMLSAVPMLVAIWHLAAVGGDTRFDALPGVIANNLGDDERTWCFFAFALAFAVKTPLIPFHSWQAPIYAACPAGAAVILAGAMAKLGTYGFLRVLLPLFPIESVAWADLFITLGVISVIGGALLALAQRDLKRLLAFSSLSHLGLIVVGIFTFEAVGLTGALIQMLAHGLSVAALFVLVGHLEERSGRRGIDDFGALAGRAPGLAVAMVAAGLIAVALPGTAGFVGEVQLLAGTFRGLLGEAGLGTALVVTALAGSSLILGAGYVLRVLQRVLYGREPGTASDRIPELAAAPAVAAAIAIVGSFALGLVPGVVTARGGEAVAELGAEARALRARGETVSSEVRVDGDRVVVREEAVDGR